LAYFGHVINSDYIALNGGMSDKRWYLWKSTISGCVWI